MNASLVIKFLPMLVMLVSLAYATYTIQWLGTNLQPVLNLAAMNQAETKGPGRGSGFSRALEDSSTIADTGRDLFQVVAKPVPGEAATGVGPDRAPAPSDTNTGLVQGLTLNATLLQGRTQLAVINGRIYHAGQLLRSRDGQPSPLSLTKVFADKVVIEANGKHYVLAYPDNFETRAPVRDAQRTPPDPAGLQGLDSQLALIQALLRSPLGGLGASLLGKGGRDLVANADSQLQGARAGPAAASAASTRPLLPVPTGRSSSPESTQ